LTDRDEEKSMAIPKEPIATHPGEVLLEEYIKPLGLTQGELGEGIRHFDESPERAGQR
jgi:hypothetical protein